jgi:hypothetical protein
VHPGRTSRFVFAVGVAVAAIGALDLLDRLGIDSGIERLNRLLVPMLGPEILFRVVNGAPIGLMLTGGSLALSRFEKYHFTATALGGLAGTIQVWDVFNYLSGDQRFYNMIAAATPLNAIGLLCAAIAIVLWIGAMPAPRKPRPLWYLLTVLECAIVTPLLLFGVYMGVRITDAERRDVRDNLMSQARTFSAAVDREVIGEIERLQALAASPSLRRGDLAEFQRQAEASLALLQRGNIVLIDRNMSQLVNTFVPFGKPLPKAVASQAIESTFATGKPQVTGLFMAPVVDQFMFGIILPVEIDGESRYVLGRSQDQHSLTRLIAANELPAGWLAVIADAAHHIIARSEQEDVFIGKELRPAQWHRAGPGGAFEFVDSEGRPSVEAYVRSELTGWQTAVWAPTALLESRVRTL